MDSQLSRKRQAHDEDAGVAMVKKMRPENRGSQESQEDLQEQQEHGPAPAKNHSVLDTPTMRELTPMDDSAQKMLTQKLSDSKTGRASKTNAIGQGREPMSLEVDPNMALVCLSDLISVPLPIIFRQVGPASYSASQSRHRPLLSRNEAQCFLSISSAAQEMDSLAGLASKVFQQQNQFQGLSASLNVLQSRQKFLKSIFTLGNIMANDLPMAASARIESSLDEVVGKLRSIIPQLRQSAEQNWSIFESLQDDALETTNSVALEKKRIAEIQDEVLRRIESLLSANSTEEQLSQSSVNSKSVNMLNCESMAVFCERIFHGEPSPSTPNPFRSAAKEGTTTPQRQTNSQSSRVSTGSKGSAPEKLLGETNGLAGKDDDQREQPTSPEMNESDHPIEERLIAGSRTPSPEALPFARTQATQNALEGLAELAAQPPPI